MKQKQTIMETEKNTDAFQNRVKIEKQNKDHMIETIYSQLKQMEHRVKNISEDNQNLRETNTRLEKVLKQYQKENNSLN